MISEKIFVSTGSNAGEEGAIDGTIDACLGQDCRPRMRFERWHLPRLALGEWGLYDAAYRAAWSAQRDRELGRERVLQ